LPLAARLAATLVTPGLLAPVVVPPLSLLLGLGAAALLFWIGWFVEPIPATADAPSFAEALAVQAAALPARETVMAWALALPGSLEAMGWVIAAAASDLALAAPGLMLLVLYHALIGGALVRFTLDVATALSPADAHTDATTPAGDA
jgi:hypothetical protein